MKNYYKIILGEQMKKILIGIIKLYQTVPGNFHNMCRHIPSCSNYAITAIETYGCFKGGYMSLKRILHCNPWGTSGYDPVIKEENYEVF